MNTTYGTKYAATKDLKRTEIAKLIRADIKAAVKAGSLPKAKYSVTCRSYSGGGSIDIHVSEAEGIRVYNVERLLFEHDEPHAYCALDVYSAEMMAVVETLDAIHASYNYDGSDYSTDYFHVRFYGDAKPAFNGAIQAAELAAALDARTARETLLRTAGVNVPKRPVLALVRSAPEPVAQPQNDFLAHIGAL